MTNLKLRERAKRIVMTITGVSYDKAADYLAKSDFHVKETLVMIKANVSLNKARERLRRANGFVRAAIDGKENDAS
jgi:N-acetylmuramic acid 6-phosphate etherase